MKTSHLTIIIVTILISGLFISSHLPTASSTCIFGANGTPTSCNSGPYIMTSYPFPLQQVRHGIPSNQVKCNQGFQLVIKSEDGSPACVKPDTAQTLIMRGWGTFTVPSIDNAYDQKMNGTLSGNVVRAGGPRSGPQVNYEVDVYASDGITIVGKTFSDTQGNYSISLPAGNYTIYAPDYPTKQTHHVSVISGKNTILNIAYGTGYK